MCNYLKMSKLNWIKFKVKFLFTSTNRFIYSVLYELFCIVGKGNKRPNCVFGTRFLYFFLLKNIRFDTAVRVIEHSKTVPWHCLETPAGGTSFFTHNKQNHCSSKPSISIHLTHIELHIKPSLLQS